jgi:hypothetical protein
MTQNFKMIYTILFAGDKIIAYNTVWSYTLQAEDLMVYLSLT